ncbi:MAG TPA: NAD-dependent epimerase/dehydratase family protein [Anaeromyxobacter sp.]
MKVLVTGATGLIGKAVARELVARGHAVRALLRPASDPAALSGLSVELVRGDVLDAASVRAALAGQEALVHVAGIPRVGDEPGPIHEVNVRGTELVLAAAREAGLRRVLHTSSISAAGGTRRPEVQDETVPGNAEALGIPYFLSKREGERIALAEAARGLPVVVLRPGVVLGPGDTHRSSASLVVAIAKRRLPAVLAGGTSFCDVRDVAAGFAAALERGRPGEVYALAGHNLSLAEFAARTAALCGVRAPVRVPYPAAWALAAFTEAVAVLRGRRAPTNRDLARAGSLFTYASSEKAVRELGYAVRPLEEMIRDTLVDALAAGRLRAETAELRALAPR